MISCRPTPADVPAFDIDLFVLALANATGNAAAFLACNYLAADISTMAWQMRSTLTRSCCC
jgi:hypothetical protein